MKNRYWTNYVRGGVYWVGLVDEIPEFEVVPGIREGARLTLVKEHPIPFTDIRESARAVARLNAAYGLVTQ